MLPLARTSAVARGLALGIAVLWSSGATCCGFAASCCKTAAPTDAVHEPRSCCARQADPSPKPEVVRRDGSASPPAICACERDALERSDGSEVSLVAIGFEPDASIARACSIGTGPRIDAAVRCVSALPPPSTGPPATITNRA